MAEYVTGILEGTRNRRNLGGGVEEHRINEDEAINVSLLLVAKWSKENKAGGLLPSPISTVSQHLARMAPHLFTVLTCPPSRLYFVAYTRNSVCFGRRQCSIFSTEVL